MITCFSVFFLCKKRQCFSCLLQSWISKPLPQIGCENIVEKNSACNPLFLPFPLFYLPRFKTNLIILTTFFNVVVCAFDLLLGTDLELIEGNLQLVKSMSMFIQRNPQPLSGGSVVSVADSWPGNCEFNPWLRQIFFLAYFRLSPLQKHVRKVVSDFGKKSCVSTGVRKPGNTCVTDRHMTLAVKVALNPNTTNQNLLALIYTGQWKVIYL